MNAQVILRKIAASAEHFAKLHQVSRGCSDARIQSQAIAFHALKLKADPMVLRYPLWAQNCRLPLQILNDRFQFAIIKKIADCHSTAYLRNLDRSPRLFADVLECSIALIPEQQLWLQVSEIRMNLIHLRIDVSVDHQEVLPAIIIEVDKSVTPSHIAMRASSDSSGNRDVREAHSAVIAIERGVFVVKVRDQQRHAPRVQVIAHGNAHVGLPGAALAQPHPRSEADLLKLTLAIALVKIVWLPVVGDKQI